MFAAKIEVYFTKDVLDDTRNKISEAISKNTYNVAVDFRQEVLVDVIQNVLVVATEKK